MSHLVARRRTLGLRGGGGGKSGSDEYMTPKVAWEKIAHLIPRRKVIWEAFRGDGSSAKHLRSLGFKVISRNVDFFKANYGDIIVTNPPFSIARQIVPHMVKTLKKPFIMIMLLTTITTNYFREAFEDEAVKPQIIIPRQRICFNKLVNGKVPESWTGTGNQRPSFDCVYVCWRMNLPSDIVFL